MVMAGTGCVVLASLVACCSTKNEHTNLGQHPDCDPEIEQCEAIVRQALPLELDDFEDVETTDVAIVNLLQHGLHLQSERALLSQRKNAERSTARSGCIYCWCALSTVVDCTTKVVTDAIQCGTDWTKAFNCKVSWGGFSCEYEAKSCDVTDCVDDVLEDVAESFSECFSSITAEIDSSLRDYVGYITDGGCDSIDSCKTAVLDGLDGVWDLVASETIDKIPDLVDDVLGALTTNDVLTQAANEGSSFISTVSSAVTSLAESFSDFIDGSLPDFTKPDFGSVCTPDGTGLWGMTPTDCGAFDSLKSVFQDFGNAASNYWDAEASLVECAMKTGLFGFPTPFFELSITEFCLPDALVTAVEYMVGAVAYTANVGEILATELSDLISQIQDFAEDELGLFQIAKEVHALRHRRLAKEHRRLVINHSSFATNLSLAYVGVSNSSLYSGVVLNEGETLDSTNGVYSLRMQYDGNLVEYHKVDGRESVTWHTGTSGQGSSPYYAKMQGDGNFVVYGADGAYWSAGTTGTGEFVVMQNDGNVVVKDVNGTAVWSSQSSSCCHSSRLSSIGYLNEGDTLVSASGEYKLKMQSDGNLVIYQTVDDGSPTSVWSSGTDGQDSSPYYLKMQADGNLVVYGAGGGIWSAGTDGTGETVVMEDDGQIVVYDADGGEVWSDGPESLSSLTSDSGSVCGWETNWGVDLMLTTGISAPISTTESISFGLNMGIALGCADNELVTPNWIMSLTLEHSSTMSASAVGLSGEIGLEFSFHSSYPTFPISDRVSANGYLEVVPSVALTIKAVEMGVGLPINFAWVPGDYYSLPGSFTFGYAVQVAGGSEAATLEQSGAKATVEEQLVKAPALMQEALHHAVSTVSRQSVLKKAAAFDEHQGYLLAKANEKMMRQSSKTFPPVELDLAVNSGVGFKFCLTPGSCNTR